MAERFTRPVEQICDERGVPMAGAKLYFFDNESVTPAVIYSDPDLTIKAQNPQVSNADGRFLYDIFLSSSTYRVQLTDPDGVMLWQIDNVKKNTVDNVGARKGSIWFFYGTQAELDTLLADGWAVCDGTNNTPNMTDRFIKCTDSVADIGSTGGSGSVTPVGTLAAHTLTEAEMPSHNHYSKAKVGCLANRTNNTEGEFVGDSEFAADYFPGVYASFTMPPLEVTATGGGQPHSHGITFSASARLPEHKTLLAIIYTGEN